MGKAFKDLAGSKKAIVFFITVVAMAAIIFGGVDPEHGSDFIDKLVKLAMAYLGGQGLADLGKYAGEAYSSGKKAVESRDKDGDWKDRLGDAADAADEISEKAEEAADAAGEVAADVAEKADKIAPPPKTGE